LITIFYARFAFLNPGVPLFLKTLQERPPAGLRAIDVTVHAPDDVGRLAAESSTIAIDQSVENAATWATPDQFSIYRIRGNRPPGHYAEIAENLWAADARRLFMSNFDLHDTRIPPLVEKYRGRMNAISWMFEKRPRATDDVPAAYRDPWMSKDHDPLTTWNLIRDAVPTRVELPFSVAEPEFAEQPPIARWDAGVPGAPYATRRIAMESFRAADVSCVPERAINRAATAVSRTLGFTLPSEAASLATIVLLQQLQRALVRSSALTFVCGSGVAFATRKFFEIPALRSPMLAYPCIGFEDYGFRHGENAIATLPEDAGRDARWLRARPEAADRIAREGQAMMRRLHRVDTRVNQFAECLRRLDRDDLHHAEFVGGQYEIS
jgi:hypothetical protein